MPIKIGNFTLQSRVYVPPMAGVTDIVFRQIVRSIDPQCMMSTEMVSSRALLARPESRIMDLDPDEHPIGIQIFGHEPDVMANAAQLAQKKAQTLSTSIWVALCPRSLRARMAAL